MMDTEFFCIPIWSVFLVLALTVLFYRYSTENHDFWEKKQIPYVKPLPFVGTLFSYMKKPIQEVDVEWHKKYGRIYGSYDGTKPVLMVSEPSILRDILVKDFPIFHNRRARKLGDPIIDKALFIQEGKDWKRVRKVITHTFSTGKITKMVPVFKDSIQTLILNFNKAIERGEAINVERTFGAFTMDVIASCAFSVKLDSFNDPDNEFVCQAKRLSMHKYNWRKMMFYLFPHLTKWLSICYLPPSCTNFFRDVSLKIIKERKRTGQTRNDFLQLLMNSTKDLQDDPGIEWKEKGSEDERSNHGGVSTEIFKNATTTHLSMDELVAQCVIFFIGGYDTTTRTLSLATYELALNPDVQEKLHREIVNTVREANGDLTYEALQSMKYLDCIVSETLRLFPVLYRIDRQSVAEYTLRDTGIKIPKNMVVIVPIFAIHRDPEFFPNPDKFDPDRFFPEERQKRDPYCYLPFGAGPRNCIAKRFGLIAVKLCLAYIVANFKIKQSSKTQVPLKFLSGQGGLLQPIDIYVSMVPRDDNPIFK